MKRGGPLRRSTPLRRGKRLRPMSDKRRGQLDERRDERMAVNARDGGRCWLEGVADTGPCFGGPSPHHLEKSSHAGPYRADNLVTLCVGHNNWVEDHPNEAWELGLVIRNGES